MMVERSKLERVMGEKSKKTLIKQKSPLKRPNTRASRALENSCKDDDGADKATIKLIDAPEEITLDEEAEFGEVKRDSKRKAAEDDDLVSRRLRRRG